MSIEVSANTSILKSNNLAFFIELNQYFYMLLTINITLLSIENMLNIFTTHKIQFMMMV